MLRVGISRSGSPFLSSSGRHLNSPYDPIREAARFAEKTKPRHDPLVCLILGDTLPYLRSVLIESYPSARILSIYYDGDLPGIVRRYFGALPIESFWSPSDPRSLRSYLDEQLSEIDVQGLNVYVWPPSMAAFPTGHETAAAMVEQKVREMTGGWTTTVAFSRAWLHNLITNYLSLDRLYVLQNHHLPVVIAASGPSLQRGLSLIRRNKSRIFLLALPSSLEALTTEGIVPDLLVSVDGGYWADVHLRALQREVESAVAFPLIASRSILRRTMMPVVLSAGSFIEQELVARARLPAREIAATGTVAATAYELALTYSDGPVIFAGLDLCYDGLSEHVRPHSFDPLFEIQSQRSSPVLTVLADRVYRFGRGVGSKPSNAGSPAMQTYAGWFRTWTSNARTYRLFPSHIRFDGMQPLDEATFGWIIERSPSSDSSGHFEPVPAPSPSQRRLTVDRLLTFWQSTLKAALSQSSTLSLHLGLDTDGPTAALVAALDPRGYLRFRQTIRSSPPPESSRLAERLIENAIEEINTLKQRYLS